MKKKEHWWESEVAKISPGQLTENQKRLRVKEWLLSLIDKDISKVFSDTSVGIRFPINLPLLTMREQIQLRLMLENKIKKEDLALKRLRNTIEEEKPKEEKKKKDQQEDTGYDASSGAHSH